MSSSHRPLVSTLIEASDSVLVVIDVQDAFVNKLSSERRQPLVDRIAWLVRIAKELDIPLVVTAEDIPVLGGVCAKIEEAISGGAVTTPTVWNKMVFGLAGQPEIMKAIEETNRKTIILVGLETDVCVAHSSLGLLEMGYKVAVVQDATGSPGAAHQYGLQRMENAGIVMSSVKGLYFEWMRTVARDNEFKEKMKDSLDPPVDL